MVSLALLSGIPTSASSARSLVQFFGICQAWIGGKIEIQCGVDLD